MEKLTQAQAELVVKTMTDVALANEAYFSDLDAVMGDADFGRSLAAGFRVVDEKWETLDHSSIGALLLNVSQALTANTGGCSGPVWGTLFMRTGIAFRGKTELGLDEIIEGLRSAIEGIMKRGGASLGDKTLLDALDALVCSLEDSLKTDDHSLLDAFDRAADAAYEMRETSKGWVAKRGRQSFTGERSIGTYDPGIIAIGDMAKAIAAALRQ
ncbi:MAG: dihydroxyacetone kinase subunit L [Propionibacteriaceae bacterium]|jgi:dihydroxyacetone kinase phosphoprotein-dependent L subunit|nr:dihydroxyacetone kinase subunit L [Propionibacteriaceae bacterium]